MKVIRIALGCMVLVALTSCGSSQKENQPNSDSVEAQDTALTSQEESGSVEEAIVDEHAANYEVIKTVYNEFVFGSSEESPEPYFTPALLKKLADEYEFDCFEGNCYAFYVLRTGAQDGTDIQEVISIEPDEDGWYDVNFNDMGHIGMTKIKMVDGKIDDYKPIK